jgi:tetratricopeptide (TPR) repeat protein
MVLGLKTWRRSLLLYLQVLLSMISVLLFFVLARYRLPTVPFLFPFAAYALQWSFARCQERHWGSLAFSWLPTLAILVLCAVLVPGQAERGLEARYETMGVALIREGRVDEGIAELRGVIQLAPKRITAHYNLGVVYLEERAQYALAAEEFETVIGLQEDYAQAHYMLGRAYGGLGRTQEAVREFLRELDFWPQDLTTRLALGMAYVKLERWPEAEEQFRQVTQLQADNVGGHRLLGNVLYLRGEYQRARVSWERALELNPSDEELRNTLESLRKRLEERKTAAPGGP